MRTDHGRYVSVDKRLDKLHRKSEQRAFFTIYHKTLSTLYTSFYRAELTERLLVGCETASAHPISFYQSLEEVGRTVPNDVASTSIQFTDQIREHRRHLESFSKWTILSEYTALQYAEDMKFDPCQSVVLVNEIAGSESLCFRDRDVEIVCSYSNKRIPLCSARPCACGMLVSSSDAGLKAAAEKHGHDCRNRERVARSVVTRLISKLEFFPFCVLLCPDTQRVVAPCLFSTALGLLHEGVFPLLPRIADDDVIFIKRNSNLVCRLLDSAQKSMRLSGHLRTFDTVPDEPRLVAVQSLRRCTFRQKAVEVEWKG
jgi:hypothetical protein